jgi:hypothetical protein
MAFCKKGLEIEQGAVISRPLIIKKLPSPICRITNGGGDQGVGILSSI